MIGNEVEMPSYLYVCQGCKHHFDVHKPLSEIDRHEQCPICNTSGVRRIARVNIDKASAGDWNRMERNHAFGKAMTPKQAEKEAKRRGWIELGNEPLDKIHKRSEKTLQENLKAKYERI